MTRNRKPLTPEQKRRHAELERKRRKLHAELSERIRFDCAMCGRSFIVPDGLSASNAENRFRSFVRIGGRLVCEVCARARYRRRRNIWGINPDAIQ